MKKALMFLIAIFFFACDSKDEDILCFNYDTSMSFSVLNAKGEDLLDPEIPNGFDVSKIRLFYEINGEVKEQGLNPDFRAIFKNMITNKYQITIPLNSSDLNKKTVTYIQWDEKHADTLQSTFDTRHCYTGVDKVWLNNELILDGYNKKYVYTLVK
ncbi:hypothetical protein [Flavobacterium denitrificans]|uniref:hypothetical protein n=1 Tax=Flavobacterium denitrificans TaxID=281361 RepID=UPI000479C0FF|nr:hypothetical protein [Flavobacterium denitrificans]